MTASTRTSSPSEKKKKKPRKRGAPKGNKNALKHGAYSAPPPTDDLAERIQDLRAKRERLSAYIDEHAFDAEPLEYAKLTDLLGRLDSRITRLEQQRRSMSGEQDDDFVRAVDGALQKLAEEWGVSL